MAETSSGKQETGNGGAGLVALLVWGVAVALLFVTKWRDTSGPITDRLKEVLELLAFGGGWSLGLAAVAAAVAYGIGMALRNKGGTGGFGWGGLVAVLLAVASFQIGLLAGDEWWADFDATSAWLFAPAYCLPIAVYMVARGRSFLDAFAFGAATGLAFFLAVFLGVQLTENMKSAFYVVGFIGGAVGAVLSLTGFWLLGSGYRNPVMVLAGTVVLSAIGGAAFYLMGDTDEKLAFQLTLYVPWQAVFSVFVIRGLLKS